MSVTGIGGPFFRSRDPGARAEWYGEHLGIEVGSDAIWPQESGMTVFAPFVSDSNYLPADQKFMLNLHVKQLDALVGRLESAGVEVERRDEWEAD